MNPGSFILERDAVMRPYMTNVAVYCVPFSCEDSYFDELFSKDAFLYETELLGKTYAWINTADPSKILGKVLIFFSLPQQMLRAKSRFIPNFA